MKVTLNSIVSGDLPIVLINDNFEAIQVALENTLSRDGTSPNTMTYDLDMNSYRIINLNEPTTNSEAATKLYVDSHVTGPTGATGPQGPAGPAGAGTGDMLASLNLSDVVSVSAARANLGLTIGSNVQAYNANLTSFAAITPATIPYTPTGTIGATTVQAAISEVVADLLASSGSSLVSFLQAGTGAEARTIQTKFREIINAKDFGAVGDGSHDDTLQLQAAITAASGKRLYIPAGTYKYSLLTVTANNTSICGDGRNTRLVTNAAAGGVNLDIGDGVSEIRGIDLEDLVFWASVAQTTQSTIRCRKIARSNFRNVYIGTLEDKNIYGNMLYKGIDITEFGSVSIQGGNILCSGTGLYLAGNAAQTFGAEFFLGGGYRIIAGGQGIHIAGGAGGVHIDDTDISACGLSGILVDDTIGAYNREIFLGNNLSIDSCASYGLSCLANSVVLFESTGTWFAANSIGVVIAAAQPSGAIFKFVGPRVYGNTSHGMYFTAGSIVVSGGAVNGNGTAAGGDGIYRAGSTLPFIVTGVLMTANGVGGVGHGLEINAAADNFVITGNISINNTTSNISNGAGTSATKVVANNVAP